MASANILLGNLEAAGARIRQSADEYLVIKSDLGAKLDAIQKDLKNAKPLPVGSRPDDFRVRKLSDAVPPLDSALATPCRIPDAPAAPDYDAWQERVMREVLGALGECAAKHRKTVEAWPG